MFTWNLPALIRNVVILGIVCIALNWNLLAWFIILFLWFVEMDEELTKYENYSDFYTAQLELYDFSNAKKDGWNLEEQLRVFNQQNPQVVQEYQRTFSSRIQELRKRPTKTKPQDKAKKSLHRKAEAKFKQEVFGYTENYWDIQDDVFTNHYVEVINHISSAALYEWYHQNGLVIPEPEYGIKNICLYHDKYTELAEDEYNQLPALQHTYEDYVYNHIGPAFHQRKTKPLYYRIQDKNNSDEDDDDDNSNEQNNLLYWHMSKLQLAQYHQVLTSKKKIAQDTRAGIKFKKHLEYLATPPQAAWNADIEEVAKLQTLVKKTTTPV